MPPIRRIPRRILALGAAAALALCAPATAPAAFPGQNGKLAYTGGSYETGTDGEVFRWALFTANLDGTGAAKFRGSANNQIGLPAWSAQGTRIAYVRTPPNHGDVGLEHPGTDVWVANADGSGERQVTPDSNNSSSSPAWYPGGAYIAYTENRRLYRIRVSGGEPQAPITAGIINLDEHHPTVAPNNTKVAFEGAGRGDIPSGIYTVSTSGGLPALLIEGGGDPDYSPNGQKIAYTRFAGNVREIWIADSDGTDPVQLAAAPATSFLHPAFTPDGKKVLYGIEGNNRLGAVDVATKERALVGQLEGKYPAVQPLVDSDGDGLLDTADACPNEKGIPPNGCPAPPDDRDGDGIKDAQDGCPDVAAPGTPNGCPASPPPPPTPGPTDGPDTLTGDGLANVLCGLGGADKISGGDGDDTLWGDACNKNARPLAGAQATTDGNDTLNGDAGNDKLYGSGGKDKLNGGDGNDALSGGSGNDKLKGGKGKDSLKGGAGKDSLDGGDGDDKLDGGKDANKLKGGSGNDSISARNGKKETVDCGSGKKDKATVDRADKVKGCEKVSRPKKK